MVSSRSNRVLTISPTAILRDCYPKRVNREDFARLLTLEAQQLLASVGDLDAKSDVVKLVSKLRSDGHDAGLVASVLSQAKLRRRARAKFGEFADSMLFTEAGLEQASRLSVSALHAGRFRAAGIKSVADLGCGIGSESLALASLDLEVHAFEIDEVTAAAATYNLAPFANASVELADVTKLDLSGFEALFFDPARRELQGAARARAIRKFDPAEFSPNFDWVVQQAQNRPTGIKLGPGHPHEGIPEASGAPIEAQWVSVAGDLVELGLWFGAVAREGVARSALLIDSAGRHHEFNSASAAKTSAPLGELGRYLYEPDNAIVRSHLIGPLAESLGLRGFAPEIAYLTSDEPVESAWLKSYRVLDEMPFDRKKLKAYLRERGIGILEIKKRGADIVPENLRKELQLKGESAATLVVTRVGDAHRAIIAESRKP
ncbi:MAG: SAM-dependent methyltransferase [Actinomycetales bacterium]|nr:SAM-dependent methyltransferase [Actinomycetales bacterium]